ncbi:MAG: diacylglycerol kinase [Candidatus Moranbacteria bacterium CG_4_9_14_3_um_filter_40_7]|nr:MAG: diacylglycerol kinase [Candidatus Moranbacteria bacterium CG23_combo_of_CG06-09_8_20_14_all_40_16]PIU80619.1 MAG: diacylglycerol kinase [Candidatus Moranbacteria bacterium CG06_land_8_20_14_3_00_40_12]PJA87379.1 MAG: diacylglycerol kinase [Candidatus Moranbacteria bacterium CG_4_9_14_3_um_filter_40_7]
MERLEQFKKSLRYAFRGLDYVVRHEKNFQNQLVAAILVMIAMIYFNLAKWEIVLLFLVIMVTLIMELLNTVMERVVDMLKPSVHPYAKLIKDLMAAAVLVTSILAVVIGIVIFSPHLKMAFSGF